MFRSASILSENARKEITESLMSCLVHGLDLYSQLKVAHWNIRGPHFASLHELFEKFAVSLNEHNDEIAERAVILGGKVHATTRHVAKSSTLPEYSTDCVRDLDHVEALSERFSLYLHTLRVARKQVDTFHDEESVDLLTGVIRSFEKFSWFLQASLYEKATEKPSPTKQQSAE